MPELPEVETVRRTLQPHVAGARVSSVRLARADVCVFEAGVGRSGRPAALLAGGRVESLERAGKQLALLAHDGRALVVHLGMSGSLRFEPGPGPGSGGEPPHTHVVWSLEREGAPAGRLVFRDPRRFGGVWAYGSAERLRSARWSALGPDAITIDGATLGARLGRTRRWIKPALLDQGVLAGLGNIYADEALFRAGIDPRRRADSLDAGACEALAGAIRAVLEEGVLAGGASLRDYVDGNGRRGRSQERFRVYGRGGEPCVVCGSELCSASIGQRTTVWCVRCQA